MPEDKKLPSLDALQHKIDDAKRHFGEKRERQSTLPDPTNLSQGIRYVVEMAAGIAVGTVLGYYLDRWLHTSPWFFIICFFLGAAAGFRNLVRDAMRTEEEDKE